MTPIQGPNFIFLAVTSQNEAKKPWLPLIDMFRTKKIDLSMGMDDVRTYFNF